MTTESHVRKSVFFANTTIWIPTGMAVGLLAGHFLGDVPIGLSIGLMTGSVVAMCLERKTKKKPSRAVIAVGVLAIVVVTIIGVVDHQWR